MLGDDGSERVHQKGNAFVGHHRNAGVEEAALPKERVGSAFDGVGFHGAVQATVFGCRPEQSQQRLRERSDEQESISSVRSSDMRVGQSHPEAEVLGVAEVFLDRC
jgi:hypothetical protein